MDKQTVQEEPQQEITQTFQDVASCTGDYILPYRGENPAASLQSQS